MLDDMNFDCDNNCKGYRMFTCLSDELNLKCADTACNSHIEYRIHCVSKNYTLFIFVITFLFVNQFS